MGDGDDEQVDSPGEPPRLVNHQEVWAKRRAAEAEGRKLAGDLLAQAEEVRRAALYRLSDEDPTSYILAKYGPSKEALDVEDEVIRLRVRHEAKVKFERELRPEKEPPELVDLTSFLKDPDDDARYRVDKLWPTGGRVVLSAQHKAGKTTLIANLIRSLVDGERFLDEFTTERASRVVLIDNELSTNMIRLWLREQSISTTDAVCVLPLRGRLSSFDLLDPDIRKQWAAKLRAADVLIFDCLRPALDALGLSEDKEAGRFLEALDALALEADIGELVVVHHMGHSNERSRGDSRILDWPDAVWKLVKERVDDPTSPRYFAAYGRDVDQPEVRLAYSDFGRNLRVDGGSRREAKADQIQTEVREFVAAHPGCTQTQVEDGVTGDRTAVRLAIRKLEKVGDLRIETDRRSRRHFPAENGETR